ncbi:TatD family hydrolase [Alteromonas sp. 5E99-2]|uniref:TatD family hydrolase n=1 Tax=Alteromonas sp. 5E99-2 TaxID=2817683 RepID=UPI001A98DEBD|nr:TatD family hydrolase [Alteromonas sp. 5E99-2]MBO1255302.1 TatD family hydrolase [Alteromonas sp. 5E99-2]
MLIDSHCHLDLPDFSHDLAHVVSKAQGVGVQRMHIPGTTRAGWERQIGIAKHYPCIDYSFGLHPFFLNEHWKCDLKTLENQFSSVHQACALGEIGLDKVCSVPWLEQVSAFERQLALAKELRLPVILHHRKTHDSIMASVKRIQFHYGGIVHGFSGSIEVAKAYIDRGFVLGIGGTITYDRAVKTRNTLRQLPLSTMVLETDSPDMPMKGLQGIRNEPVNIVHVADCLSELLNEDLLTIKNTTSNNYLRVLGLK